MSTFTWSPQTANKTKTPRVRVAPFGDGYAQRTADGINNKPQEWSLTFVKDEDTIDAVDDFLDTQGSETAFDWTAPDGTVGRWICESWSTSYNAETDTLSLSATFKQVFGQ